MTDCCHLADQTAATKVTGHTWAAGRWRRTAGTTSSTSTWSIERPS